MYQLKFISQFINQFDVYQIFITLVQNNTVIQYLLFIFKGFFENISQGITLTKTIYMDKQLGQSEQFEYSEQFEQLEQLVLILNSNSRKSSATKPNPIPEDIDLNNYNAEDETVFTQLDKRQQVTDLSQPPFSMIGKVYVEWHARVGNAFRNYTTQGTGTKVSDNVVITSAHIFCLTFKQPNKTLKITSMTFYPAGCFESSKKQENGIKVSRHYISPAYMKKQTGYAQRYDMALLVLQDHPEQSNGKQGQYLPLCYDYAYWKNPQATIMLAGYPNDLQSKDINQNQSNNKLFKEERVAYKQKDTFLLYQHSTDHGSSGSGILIKGQNQGQYKVIGFHKGGGSKAMQSNYGILINEFPSTLDILTELIEQNNLEEFTKPFYRPSNKKLLKQNQQLKNKLQTLQKQLKNSVPLQKVKQLQSTIESLKKENNKLNDLKYLQTKNKDLQSELLTVIGQKQKVVQLLVQSQSDWKQLQSKLKSLQSRIKKLNSQLLVEKGQKQELTRKLEKYQQDLMQLKLSNIKDYEPLQSKCKEMESKLLTAKDQKQGLEQRLETLQQALRQLKLSNITIKEENVSLHNSNLSQEKLIEDYQTEKQTLLKRIEVLEQQNSDNEFVIFVLKSEEQKLTKLQLDHDKLKSDMTVLQRINTELTQTNAMLHNLNIELNQTDLFYQSQISELLEIVDPLFMKTSMRLSPEKKLQILKQNVRDLKDIKQNHLELKEVFQSMYGENMAKSSLSHQISIKPPNPSTPPKQYLFQVFGFGIDQRITLIKQQTIISMKAQYGLEFHKGFYDFNHSSIPIVPQLFVMSVWDMVETLNLNQCGVTNESWQFIASRANVILPRLVALGLQMNPLSMISHSQLKNFPQLSYLALDEKNFSQAVKTDLKSYKGPKGSLMITFS